MLTHTRETADLQEADLQELEALWKLPAPRTPRVGSELAARLSERIVSTLAWAWPVLLISLLALEPAPQPNAHVAVWVEVVSNLLLLTLLAGVVARFGTEPRVGLGFFGAAGAMGIALGIGCRTTGHHAGSWWAVETVVFSLLALAAFAGLALAQRARA